jgi:hypothetical protein
MTMKNNNRLIYHTGCIDATFLPCIPAHVIHMASKKKTNTQENYNAIWSKPSCQKYTYQNIVLTSILWPSLLLTLRKDKPIQEIPF